MEKSKATEMATEAAHFGLDQIHDWESFKEILLVGTLGTPRNLFIILAVWFLHHAIVDSLARLGKRHRRLRSLADDCVQAREIIYMFACIGLVWVEGLRPEIQSWGFRFALGCILGGATMLVPWALGKIGDKLGIEYFKNQRGRFKD